MQPEVRNPRWRLWIVNTHISACRLDRNKIPTATPIFPETGSNDVITGTVRRNWKSVIQDGGHQTGIINTYISACRLDRNKISTAIAMFSGTRSPMTLPRKLSDVTGSQKSKMAATKPEVTHISACRQDSNEIPTATPMFSRTGIPMVLLCILSVTTGSQKSKMAALKRCQLL